MMAAGSAALPEKAMALLLHIERRLPGIVESDAENLRQSGRNPAHIDHAEVASCGDALAAQEK